MRPAGSAITSRAIRSAASSSPRIAPDHHPCPACAEWQIGVCACSSHPHPEIRQGGVGTAVGTAHEAMMSKAFAKETDIEVEAEDGVDEANPLPAGSKNYMTPEGFQRLRDELRQLSRIERPKVVEIVSWAAGNGDRSENGDYLYGKKRLREIDRRLRFLTKRLEIAEIVDPAAQPQRDRVFFGATVTYVTERDEERTVTIL